MDELYLILHKVRGQPALDVAISSTAGDEEIWIIPTSGHRAHPYWFCRVDHIDFLNGPHPRELLASLPEDWPDHYAFHNLKKRVAAPHLRPIPSTRVETEDLAL